MEQTGFKRPQHHQEGYGLTNLADPVTLRTFFPDSDFTHLATPEELARVLEEVHVPVW